MSSALLEFGAGIPSAEYPRKPLGPPEFGTVLLECLTRHWLLSVARGLRAPCVLPQADMSLYPDDHLETLDAGLDYSEAACEGFVGALTAQLGQ